MIRQSSRPDVGGVLSSAVIVLAALMFLACLPEISAQSTGHDPYINVVSNPYTSDHSPFRFGQPTAVEMYEAKPYRNTKYRGDAASRSLYERDKNSNHRGDQQIFSFERWAHRCEPPCRTLGHLEHLSVHAPASFFSAAAAGASTALPTQDSALPVENSIETHFTTPSVKSGILATPTASLSCVDSPVVDVASVCECPHGKKEDILSADGVIHGRFTMNVDVLSERFHRKPLEPTAAVTVAYRLPLQLVAVQHCKARTCETPAARYPYVVWRDAATPAPPEGASVVDIHNSDRHGNIILPDYHIHEDDLDVTVTPHASVCKKSFLRQKEFASILKKHAVHHMYERLANVARGAYAQLLANEGLCAFADSADVAPVQQVMPARQLVYVHNGPTPFDLAVPVGWHRPLAVSGIEQVFRLDGFEPTVVFVDSARLRKLFVRKTEIDPARMFPLSGEFAVEGTVALDLGISVMRKHRQFFGRSVCTSDGSCLKIPWYGDQYYTQPFADIRDATIAFRGVARIHEDGYAFLSHLDGDLDRASDTFEYRPDVEIGKHIWIREVVAKDRLADSLISEGVILGILDGLRRELQFEIDQYQFVPRE